MLDYKFDMLDMIWYTQ